MSFGFSAGDFATLGQLAWKIYKTCKDAPESFKNVTQEVLSLHAVLKELEEAYSNATLPVAQQSRLVTIGDGCRAVLEDLQSILDKYHSLGTNTKRTWDRLGWCSKDIADSRSRLISSTGLLTTFVLTSQISVQRKLDVFLQEFRDGKHEGSMVSAQTVDSLSTDERQAWRAIRKELEDIGISLAAFDANKDFIMNWFKNFKLAISTGAFEEQTAEDGSGSKSWEDDMISQYLEDLGQTPRQPLENVGLDTIPSKPLEDIGHDTKSKSASIGLQAQRSYDSSALAPPMSLRHDQRGNIRSVPTDSSDDDLSASTGGSSFSQQRKLSSCSGVSMPQSPYPSGHGRSPSLNSEHSIGGSILACPAFSKVLRPLSRQSRPPVEITSRQPSFDGRPSLDSRSRQPSSDSQHRVFTDESVHTQSSTEHEKLHESNEPLASPAPSYIYAKFSLARGRMLQRDSDGPQNGPLPKFQEEQSPMRINVTPAKSHMEVEQASLIPSPPSTTKSSADTLRSSERPSAERSRSRPTRQPPTPVSDEKPLQSSASMRPASTIKAQSNRTKVPSREVSTEEHLAKGIELHERGSLKESTCHLRIAAKSSLPTAMLLYALACRHGWGMRPNPEEGVQWLRKAADSASLEIADDEDPLKEKESALADVLECKTRRAQFALSIYELGVSHMNGWGIEMDKALALRCFEIAGSWGDADAMTEAGFCYAEGAGCKKNLKKAAKYYRMAEAKGVSMVGNSWIHKPKYADDGDNRQERPSTKQTTPEKLPRDKSRTRTLFRRNKSFSAKVS